MFLSIQWTPNKDIIELKMLWHQKLLFSHLSTEPQRWDSLSFLPSWRVKMAWLPNTSWECHAVCTAWPGKGHISKLEEFVWLEHCKGIQLLRLAITTWDSLYTSLGLFSAFPKPQVLDSVPSYLLQSFSYNPSVCSAWPCNGFWLFIRFANAPILCTAQWRL